MAAPRDLGVRRGRRRARRRLEGLPRSRGRRQRI